MTSKEIKELLLEAITDFVIAEKADDSFAAGYHMGAAQTYLAVLGEYTRKQSPWFAFWRQVFLQTL